MSDFYQLDQDQQAAHLQQLAQAALSHWEISDDARITLIKNRENAVFCLEDGDRHYALRVHRAGYHSDASLRSELQWMAALDQAGIATPKVMPSKDGKLFKVVSMDSVPEPRQVDILQWLSGAALGSVEAGADDQADIAATYRTVGRLAGLVHNQSNHWNLPDGFSRHAWDEDGLLGEDPLWGRFWEYELLNSEQRELTLAARKKALGKLRAFGKDPDRYGLIHADFLPENLIADAQGTIRLIDFDDCGFGWHLFEFATALFYLLVLEDEGFDDALAGMIAGYREVREFSEEQVAMLPTFLVIRGLVYLGWLHTRRETETAQEMGPVVVARVTQIIRDYLNGEQATEGLS